MGAEFVDCEHYDGKQQILTFFEAYEVSPVSPPSPLSPHLDEAAVLETNTWRPVVGAKRPNPVERRLEVGVI